MPKTTGPGEFENTYPKQTSGRIRALSNCMNQVLKLSWQIANSNNGQEEKTGENRKNKR